MNKTRFNKIVEQEIEKLIPNKTISESLNEETFTAVKKDTGKVSVFNSKETRDAAIKAGTHEKHKVDKDSKQSTTKSDVNIFEPTGDTPKDTKFKLDQPPKDAKEYSEPQVAAQLDKLAAMAQQAKAKGENAPDFDLCQVSIPGTNLFCAGNKGIPRAEMPQLKGKPAPNTPAAKIAAKTGTDTVDGEKYFVNALKKMGVKMTPKKINADTLKSTQSQLVGTKVAGMAKALEADPKHPAITAPIFVSKDGYVLDGHHRWAAQVGAGILSDKPVMMNVIEVDMPINKLVNYSNEFANKFGIAQKAGKVKESITEGDMTRYYDGFKILDSSARKMYKFRYIKGVKNNDVEENAISKLMRKTGKTRANFGVTAFVAKGTWNTDKTETFYESVNELRTSNVSGTKAGWVEYLENRKYIVKKPIKVDISGGGSMTLPKGTIIHNLPGGVFAKHDSLKGGNSTYGIPLKSTNNTLTNIEKNSKVLESKINNDVVNKIIKEELDRFMNELNVNSLKSTKDDKTLTYKQAISTKDDDKAIESYIEKNYPDNYYAGMGKSNVLGKTGRNLKLANIKSVANLAKKNNDKALEKLVMNWVNTAKANGLVESINENATELRKIMQVAKNRPGPFTVIAIDNYKRKVVKQEHIKDWQLIPASYRVMEKNYPNAIIHVEDSEGKRVYRESVNEGYMLPAKAKKLSIGDTIKTIKHTYKITGYGNKSNAFLQFEVEDEKGEKYNIQVSLRGSNGIRVAKGRSLNFPEQEELLESINEASVTIRAFGETETVNVVVKKDKTGHPFVVLDTADATLGHGNYATITVILPETNNLPKDEFFAKGWSENKEILVQLIKNKVLIPTGKTAETGFVTAHSFKLNPKYK